MIFKCVQRFVAVLSLVAVAGAAQAADLGAYYGASCQSYRQSTLPMQSQSVIEQTVLANLASAIDGMNDPAVQGSRQPSFIWAMEARWACAAAAGYLEGGNIDEESVGKCDCFHQRYLSFR